MRASVGRARRRAVEVDLRRSACGTSCGTLPLVSRAPILLMKNAGVSGRRAGPVTRPGSSRAAPRSCCGAGALALLVSLCRRGRAARPCSRSTSPWSRASVSPIRSPVVASSPITVRYVAPRCAGVSAAAAAISATDLPRRIEVWATRGSRRAGSRSAGGISLCRVDRREVPREPADHREPLRHAVARARARPPRPHDRQLVRDPLRARAAQGTRRTQRAASRRAVSLKPSRRRTRQIVGQPVLRSDGHAAPPPGHGSASARSASQVDLGVDRCRAQLRGGAAPGRSPPASACPEHPVAAV